ncbi:uncharacterized protein LOC131073496 [Cryptomeria japonica]|uniref:uncharacterized protein LOC131073496 n=1 Tax=Cryptomeria japonica TaxID=3369 RepID=UPI0027DA3C2E|nr:uncharacterized protein LOC131073496 [Cryptomeria japonica]
MANREGSTVGSASGFGPLVDACPSWYVGTRPKGARDKAWKYAFERTKSGLLTNVVDRARQVVEDQIKEWKQYGCTIFSDGWIDGKNHTIINFLVACKNNMVFLKSMDASNKVNNAETLALMLEQIVMKVGVENVMQIITDNVATYVAAGRILPEKPPLFFEHLV